jgi:hypothetical protein
MTRTKLSFPNIALLVLGVIISSVDAFLSAMTAGFGADPIHDVKSGAMVAVILVSLALLPSSIAAFWWSKIGAVTSWSIFGVCSVCVLLGGAWNGMVFMIIAFVQSLIATAVDSRSKELTKSDESPV